MLFDLAGLLWSTVAAMEGRCLLKIENMVHNPPGLDQFVQSEEILAGGDGWALGKEFAIGGVINIMFGCKHEGRNVSKLRMLEGEISNNV